VGYFIPVIDESTLVYQDFTGSAHFDATEKTGTEVELTGTDNQGTITIIVARYVGQPKTGVKFNSGLANGGIGKPAIKFVAVRVEGTNQGTARVTVHYTDAEISGFSDLFLAYFSGGSWHKCDNLAVSTAKDRTIAGDVPISSLSGTAIGIGGTFGPGSAIAVNEGSQQTAKGIPWSLAGGVVAGTVITVGGVILVLERNRKRSQNSS
jgi:hypothetical protein